MQHHEALFEGWEGHSSCFRCPICRDQHPGPGECSEENALKGLIYIPSPIPERQQVPKFES